MQSPGRGGWGAETSRGVVAGWAAPGTTPPGPQVRSSVHGVSPGHPGAPAPVLRKLPSCRAQRVSGLKLHPSCRGGALPGAERPAVPAAWSNPSLNARALSFQLEQVLSKQLEAVEGNRPSP